ncbi:acetate/propionate family kinase [Ligilactobacillus salivarius]|uniref:Acetate kinase n=1 Tax=Ligilactobacillus salivarius TaxID=1624 RepID=A0A1V9QQ35_9LACO|nr:acetate kinase [Ligilactobacillus salivarius]OQQ82937.1 acetate kinase [Ligilactobacillus salivarius]OQQ85992.1 acetate kinase [Ligilactobacillus salivarius]
MSKILLMNAGSSSVKWKLFELENEEVVAKGEVERIALPNSNFEIKYGKEVYQENIDNLQYEAAAKLIIDKIIELKIATLEEIKAVGHRIVAGGEEFTQATEMTSDNIAKLEELEDFAPLHNPMEVKYIKLMQNVMPNTPQYAVFDSKFFLDIPEYNAIYSLPYSITKEYKIRRYGEHGISHTYLTKEAAKMLNKPVDKLKLVTLHLGSGSSLAAIKDGKAYDTSMGFTPLTGVTMGTRAGDLDPALVPYLMKKLNLNAEEVVELFNEKSGLLGVSELSSDMRDLSANADKPQVKLAMDIFVNRIVKYAGSFFTELNGVDAIVFAGGIGENNPWLREEIVKKLEVLGVKIDSNLNQSVKEGIISPKDAKIKTLLIPTNEELEMVRQIKEVF